MVTLSRVANHVYWMARYLERAENTARLISVNSALILDLPREARPDWMSLVDITSSEATFKSVPDRVGTETQVIRFLISDTANPGSIICSIRQARENARTVRDIIPREAWERINHSYLDSQKSLKASLRPVHRSEALNRVTLAVQEIFGILSGGMSHDEVYAFMRLGQHIERADMITRIIDVWCQDMPEEKQERLKPFENILWMSVLKSLTAYQMYRRNVHSQVRRDLVVNFLLSDRQFPRSVRHCLLAVEACLQNLPACSPAVADLAELLEQLDDFDATAVSLRQLHQLIDQLQLGLNRMDAAISQTFFGD